jgi:protein-tyrosine phosphatase
MLFPWDLEGIWAGGIRTIVSLVRTNGTAIRAAGFRHYQVPLNSGLAIFPLLHRCLVRRMLPVVDFIAAEIAAGRPTLVHCHAGKDRTGAVLTGYLIRHQSLSPDEAFHRVRQVNPRAMTAIGFDRLPRLFEA